MSSRGYALVASRLPCLAWNSFLWINTSKLIQAVIVLLTHTLSMFPNFDIFPCKLSALAIWIGWNSILRWTGQSELRNCQLSNTNLREQSLFTLGDGGMEEIRGDMIFLFFFNMKEDTKYFVMMATTTFFLVVEGGNMNVLCVQEGKWQ